MHRGMLPQTDPQLQHSCIHSTNEWDANDMNLQARHVFFFALDETMVLRVGRENEIRRN